MHSTSDTHVRFDRRLIAWIGVVTTDHAVPFQCADRVCDPSVSSVPTAL